MIRYVLVTLRCQTLNFPVAGTSIFNTAWTILSWTLDNDINIKSSQGIIFFLTFILVVATVFFTIRDKRRKLKVWIKR